MEKKLIKKGNIRLPGQILRWSQVPAKTQKIFLQFEITVSGNGVKRFGLVAYPAFKSGNTWKIQKKITLQDRKGGQTKSLNLPITLGNLEISCSDLMGQVTKKSRLILTPKLYSKNPHAEYLITDETSQYSATANPSPPASPYS